MEALLSTPQRKENKTKIFALLALAVVGSVAACAMFMNQDTNAVAISNDNMKKLFAQWMLINNKFYADDATYNHRLGVFMQNYDQIIEFNADLFKTSEVTLNQFADLTEEEFVNMYTGIRGEKGESNTVAVEYPGDVPEEIDWQDKGAVGAVKNQAACGSCWAFSAVGPVEALDFFKEKKLRVFSEQQLVDCAKDGCFGCRGGWMHKAFEHIMDKGIMLESDYPYTARDGACKYDASKTVFKFESYYNLTQRSHVALKNATALTPVSIAMEAAFPFRFYKSGVITSSSCTTRINHGIVVVGYGQEGNVDHFRVRNSWGSTWGDKGYAKIERSDRNICGILELPSVPHP